MNLVCDVKPFGFMSLQSGVADHYNWFIMIDRESGDYFLDPDEMVAYQKPRQKYPSGKLGTFRLG